MADQQQLLNQLGHIMVSSLAHRLESLNYVATEEVHAGMGYDHFEFNIDRIVAEIATMPDYVRRTFEMELYSKMIEKNTHVQDLCRAHGLNVTTMPRWNALSTGPEHAGLGTLRDLLRKKSVRSTQALDKELAKAKGQQSWSTHAHHWMDAYKARHGGAPKPADLINKLLQALPPKHHTAVMATCASTMMDPDTSLNDYIEFFKQFDELQGSPSEMTQQTANPNAMQVDQLAVMQVVVAYEAKMQLALEEATARGDFARVAAVKAEMACFHCNQIGHFKSECPKKREEEEKARRDAQKEKDKALAKQAARFQKKGKGSGSH